MLTETLIASSKNPPVLLSSNTAQLKDAGIFIHTYQPQPALRSTFKKSQTNQNCLAISDTHIFAAQTQKAVVHVYSRAQGNQEAIVPFSERISSLALAGGESLLVIGTEAGRIVLWEVSTGRQLSAAASHLQPVDCLAISRTDDFALSGSADTTILVWSLGDLLSFNAPSIGLDDRVRPRHSLTGHNGPITSIAMGSGAASNNIALSSSVDKTLIIWNYFQGQALKTVLLTSVPKCVILDMADRAAFAGYEDDSVQKIEFLRESALSHIYDPSKSTAPLEPAAASRWFSVNTDHSKEKSGTLSLCLSYDGTMLLSGHEDGSINQWDVGGGRFAGNLCRHDRAPISNLMFERPRGFLQSTAPRRRNVKIVKPKTHENFSRVLAPELGATYASATQFLVSRGYESNCGRHYTRSNRRTDSRCNLCNVGLPDWLLRENIEEPVARQDTSAKGSTSMSDSTGPSDQDVAMLENDQSDATDVHRLGKKVLLLEDTLKRMNNDMMKLSSERDSYRSREIMLSLNSAKVEASQESQISQEWYRRAWMQQQQGINGTAEKPSEQVNGDHFPRHKRMRFDASTSSESP